MALTNDQLLDRIVEIEEALNTIQTAMANLASRKELKNLLAILNNQIETVSNNVEQVSQTGIGEALAAHMSDADAHEAVIGAIYEALAEINNG